MTLGGAYSRSNTGVLSLANSTGFSVTSNFSNNNDGTNVIDGLLVGANRSNTFVANNNLVNGAPASTTTASVANANVSWTGGTHLVLAHNNSSSHTGTVASLRLSGTRIVTLGSGAIINTGMIANNGGASREATSGTW